MSGSLSSVTIRALDRADYAGWLALWSGYLDFYRVDLAESVTRDSFRRLCDSADGMFALVALGAEEHPVGFAHSQIHPSTWAPAGYCYLEDLFVAAHARGTSVATALIEATAAEAHKRGVERLYWQTQQFNGRARSLYDKVGRLTSMVVYERDV